MKKIDGSDFLKLRFNSQINLVDHRTKRFLITPLNYWILQI